MGMTALLCALIAWGCALDIIYGLPINPSGASGASWNHTFVDRSVALPAGIAIDRVEVYANAPVALVGKILREVSPSTYDVVLSAPIAHSGFGWQGAPFPEPWVVPADGYVYRMGVYTPGGDDVTINGLRASRPGDVNGDGQGGFTAMTQRLPPLRAIVAGAVPPPEPDPDPDPPPPDPDPEPDPDPPPPTGTEYVFMITGQSNAANWHASAASTFRARWAEVMPGTTAHILKAAQGGAPLDTIKMGTAIFNSGVAAYTAAIAAGRIHGGLIVLHGEADSTTGDRAAKFEREWLDTIAAYREQTGMKRVVFTELWRNPNVTQRPYWADIQATARQIGALPDSRLVSSAHMRGSSGDPIHLTTADLQELARRYAEALAGMIP